MKEITMLLKDENGVVQEQKTTIVRSNDILAMKYSAEVTKQTANECFYALRNALDGKAKNPIIGVPKGIEFELITIESFNKQNHRNRRRWKR